MHYTHLAVLTLQRSILAVLIFMALAVIWIGFNESREESRTIRSTADDSCCEPDWDYERGKYIHAQWCERRVDA